MLNNQLYATSRSQRFSNYAACTTLTMKKEMLLVLWLAVSVLRPYPVIVFGAALGYRLVDTIALLIIMSFWALLLQSQKRVRVSTTYFFFIMLLLSQLVSFAWGIWVLDVTIGPRDLFEFYRYPFYLLIFSFVYQIDFSKPKKLWIYVAKPFIILGVVEMAFISLRNFSPGFAQISNLLYGGKTYLSRPIGTFYNPNFLGMFFSFYVLFLLSILLIWNPYLKKGRKILLFGLEILASYYLLQTSSRTAVVATILGAFAEIVVFCCLARKISLHHRFKTAIIIASILIGLFVVGYMAHVTIPHRFKEVLELVQNRDIDTVPNLAARWRIVETFTGYIKLSPLLGWGPAKYTLPGTIFDNNYLSILTRYGAVGMVAFLSFFIYLLYRVSRIIPKVDDMLTISFLIGFYGILCALMIGMITARFFAVQQLMSVFFAFAGIAVKISSDYAMKRPRGR